MNGQKQNNKIVPYDEDRVITVDINTLKRR